MEQTTPESALQNSPAPVSARLERRFKIDTRPISEKFGCLHELFEAQVRIQPEATALIHSDGSLSYAELDARANQLARYLKTQGAGPEKLVGLYFERSMQPVVAILACLKAGAAYIPLDPSYPVDRIRHILAESGALLLLTDHALLETARASFDGTVAALEAIADEVAALPSGRLSREESGVRPENLAYVIYTSGTTGRPKGVMAEHRHAYKFALAFNEVCGTAPSDRVYQGFSLSFDGSVEELWMAFSNGSALVVGDKRTPRFGNELAQFLASQGITYFSTVPTLLATLTDPVPSLKTVVVSGEICPAELVNRWARPGLRLLNVYGPTEATVNTTAFECVAGKPVTIGKPLKGYGIHIVDAELKPVAEGEKGELFVTGETLARGYLNQPELTAEKFLSVAGPDGRPTRLYRTGDLVRWNEMGELEFFGRVDGQVKIRGFRVELGEIESLLLEDENIRAAAVALVERDGLQELAAYVVLHERVKELERGSVLARLESRVPPYMIPGFLDVVTELPRLTSGKVDRKRLPAPVAPLVRASAELVEPATELEREIAGIWSEVLGVPRVSVEDDFFLDLGGHSLVAAKLVTSLRGRLARPATVRDVYDFPTVRKLARQLATRAPAAGAAPLNGSSRPTRPLARQVLESLSRRTRATTTALQMASIYLLYGIGFLPFALLFLAGFDWVEGALSTRTMIAYALGVTLLTWPVFLALSIAAKWLIIGRYKAGRYPVRGFYFFRWWLTGRIVALSGAGALAGTPLLPLYLRLLGAKVGRDCTLDSAMVSSFDLITIGDETSIGADTQLLGYRIEDGQLILGRITIGDRCFIGIHSALGLDSRMENEARLDDQSLLPEGERIAAFESRRGSPARPAPVNVPKAAAPRRHPVIWSLAHLVAIEALALALVVPAIPWLMLYYAAFERGIAMGALALAISVPLGFIHLSLHFVALKKLVLARARPGVYPIESVFCLRKWMADGLMKTARALLLPLYTTLYFPAWLRLLGARIGARAELSTVWNFSPELVEVGEESFFADGSIIGGRRAYRGSFEIGVNRIGRRSFVGNSAILPVGQSLGDNGLLGVQSAPPAGFERTPDGSEWLGSPAFQLPHRVKVGNFDARVTFKPTARLYLERGVIDALRILIPGFVALTGGVAGVLALTFIQLKLGTGALLALAPAVGLALGLYAIACVVALKKAVMGEFKPVIVPLWSRYVWLNEMVNGAYESIMAPALGPYLGTPLVAPLLRLLGMRIGEHTHIDTTLFSEWDLIEIGDHAALNAGAIIQTHLFEDRVMKSSYLRIREECSVGNMAVVLYDTEMQRGSCLRPLSLLMKGETLAPHGIWHGIPTTQVAEHVFSLHEAGRARRRRPRKTLLGLAASLGTGITR